jgi:hypothetical protein
MRRRKLAPLAGLVALAVVGLTGCAFGAPPAPTPTLSASPTATVPVPAEPTNTPTTVEALPGSALVRVSVTAEAEGEKVRLQLTFNRAQTAEIAADAFQAVQEACPNAIESQLEIHPGMEPTGVITSELSMVGDWPDGMTVAVISGGVIASFGEGSNVAPIQDAPGAFGCTVPIVTGPGTAEFTSLLLGAPGIVDRIDLEDQVARGIFGFQSDADSPVEVRWVDCIIQLSSAAERLSAEFGWTTPAQWGDGCLIGEDGAV